MDSRAAAVFEHNARFSVFGEGRLAPVYGGHRHPLSTVDVHKLGVHEGGSCIEPNINAVQIEPVQRGDLVWAGRLRVVVCDQTDFDSFLVHCVQQGREDREGLVALCVQVAANALAIALLFVVCAAHPTINT